MNSAISVPVLLLDCAAVDHRCVPRLVQQDTLFPYLPLTVCLASTPDKAPPNATKAPPTATAATTTTATSKLLRYRQELRLDGDSKLPFISTVVASRELRAVRRVIVSSGVSYQKLVSVVAPAIAAGVDLPLDSVEAPWPLPMLPATKVTVNKRDSMVNGKADDAAWTAALSMTTELDLGQCTVDHGPRICALASRLTSLSFEAHPTEATKIIDCFFQLPAPRPALRELESYLWSSTPTLLPLPVDHVGHLRRLHLSAWPVEGIVAFIAANASTLEDLVINFDPFRVQESDAPDYSPLLTVPTALPRLRRLYVQGTMSGKVQSMLSAAVSQPLERLETHDVDWASPLRVNISELVSICPAFFAHPRPDVRVLETSTDIFFNCAFNNLVELNITGELSSGWAGKLQRYCPPSLRVLSISTNGRNLVELQSLSGLPALRWLTVKFGRSSIWSARDGIFCDALPFPHLEHLTVTAYDDTDYSGDAMGGFDDGHDEDPPCPAVPTAEDFSAMLQRHPRLLEVTLGSSSYGTAQKDWVAAWRKVEARAVPPNRPLLLTLQY